jgi:hypothetical protein
MRNFFKNFISVFNTKKARVFWINLLLKFLIRDSVHEMARNSAELNSGKFRGIQRKESYGNSAKNSGFRGIPKSHLRKHPSHSGVMTPLRPKSAISKSNIFSNSKPYAKML